VTLAGEELSRTVPRQRGINKHTKGLLRQYLPKGSELSGFTQEKLDAMA